MKLLRPLLVVTAASALVLGACRTGTTPGPARTTTARSVSPTPPESTAEPALLQAPKGEAIALEGRVQVDASYLLAAGGGNAIGNGDLLLAAGGGLISEHGGGLVGKVKLIANNGGSVVAFEDGNVVAPGGAGVISDNGGGLLSDHGVGIVANNGSGLIGKTKYGVLQAKAPSFGQQAPAAGMRLQVVDMTRGTALPLGQDAAGKPVYAIYTNLAGKYKVFIPAAHATNVRLVASVPEAGDPRLHYQAITPPRAGEPLAFDEDTAAVTRYLRQVLAAKFAGVLDLRAKNGEADIPDDQLVDGFFGGSANAAAGAFVPLLKDLLAEIRANPRIERADFVPLALLLGDVVLAHAGDLAAIELDTRLYSKEANEELADNPLRAGKALAVLATLLQQFRERVTAVGAGKTPAQVAELFAAKPYIQRANAFHAKDFPADPQPYYAIQKPTDLADFLMLEYFSLVRHASYGCTQGLDCPTPTPKPSKGAPKPPPCELATGCFPPGGLPDLSPEQIADLGRAVALDIGLEPGDMAILGAGAESVVTGAAIAAFDPAVNGELRCLIRNYKQETPVCVPEAP